MGLGNHIEPFYEIEKRKELDGVVGRRDLLQLRNGALSKSVGGDDVTVIF